MCGQEAEASKAKAAKEEKEAREREEHERQQASVAAAAERRKAQRDEAVKRAAEKVEVTQVDVVIKQSVTFEKGQVVCQDAAIPALVRAAPNLAGCAACVKSVRASQIAVAEVMKDHPGSKLNVRGRPDRADGGNADFQCRIAADRAEAVCDWLVAQGSISLSRLRTSYVPSAATLVCI